MTRVFTGRGRSVNGFILGHINHSSHWVSSLIIPFGHYQTDPALTTSSIREALGLKKVKQYTAPSLLQEYLFQTCRIPNEGEHKMA